MMKIRSRKGSLWTLPATSELVLTRSNTQVYPRRDVSHSVIPQSPHCNLEPILRYKTRRIRPGKLPDISPEGQLVKSPNLSVPTSPSRTSPKIVFTQKINTFLTSFPADNVQAFASADFDRSRKFMEKDFQNIKLSLRTKHQTHFSLSRKKFLEEELVASKAKIRMMLQELKVKLRQAHYLATT